MQHSLMTRVSSVRAKHPCYPALFSVRTLSAAGLKENRGQRSTSAGGRRFDKI